MDKTKSRHRAVFDSSDKVEFKEHGNIGVNIIRDFINWCEEKQLYIILGSKLATDTASVGSYGQGALHAQQIVTNAQYHRRRLSSVLKKDLIMDIVDRNKENFRVNVGFTPSMYEFKDIDFTMEYEEIKKEALKANLKDYRGNLENTIGTGV